MKRQLILLLSVLNFFSLGAQDLHLVTGPSFSLLNYTTSPSEGTAGTKTLTGFNAQVGVDYLKLKYFNLSSELGFIQKGGKFYIMEVTPEGEILSEAWFTDRLHFLTINTTANFKIPVKDFIIPYIFLGPRLDYLGWYHETAEFIKVFDDAKKLNRFIYGLSTGAGIKFKVKKFLLGVVFDYYLNFNDLVHSVSSTEDVKLIDRTFTANVLIGYILR